MATMNEEQYQRWARADDDGKKVIEREGYGGKELIIDVDVEPKVLPSIGEIEDGLSDGKSKGEIGEEFGISAQKIGSILKKG